MESYIRNNLGPSNPESDFRNRPVPADYAQMIFRWLDDKNMQTPFETEAKELYDSLKSKSFALTHGKLTELLELTGSSYGDMFNMFYDTVKGNGDTRKYKTKMVPFQIPSESMNVMLELCENLSLLQRLMLVEYLRKTAPEGVLELQTWQGKLTNRVVASCSYKRRIKIMEFVQQLAEEEDAPVLSTGLGGYPDPIKIGDLPTFSAKYGVSIHWILQLDGRTHMYSTKSEVDEILDYFSLQSDYEQLQTIEIVRRVIAEEKQK